MQNKFLQVLILLIFLMSVSSSAIAQWLKLDSGTDLWLRGVDFINPSTGIVVGYDGTILHTLDGGDTWIPRDSGTDLDLLGVQYADPEVIYVTGALGIVLKSMDAGLTWSIVKEGGAVTHECFFLNRDLGYIAGEGGQVFKTINGGADWERLPVGVAGKVALHFVDEEIGYFVGLGNQDAILKTSNGGFTFESINTFGYEEYSSVFFTNLTDGYVVNIGGRRIMKTEDEGENWFNVMPNTGARMYDVTFANEDFGQAIGGFPDRSVILRTEDAGESWFQEDSTVSDPLFDSEMISEDYGFAVGMNGTILRRGNLATSLDALVVTEVGLYPNPASDFINLSYSGNELLSYEVLHISGQQMQVGEFETRAQIGISALPSGLYFVRFTNGKQKLSIRFEKLAY